MRRNALKLCRRMGLAAVSGVLLAGILSVLLLQSGSVRAIEYEPFFDATVDDDTAEANATFTTLTDIPAPNPNYSLLTTFIPEEWGLAEPGVPIGAWAGELNAVATLGLLNAPCQSPLAPSFDMLVATTDTSDTVSMEEQFPDSNGDGLRDGVDKYPAFLIELYPTPSARLWGYANVGGTEVSLSFLLYEPGTSLPDYPPFPASRGYPSVTVLNDPTAPLVPGLITDFCTPLETENMAYGVTKDWPGTPADESGYVMRTNPQYGGTYTSSMFSRSQRDADDDGIENDLDTCPHIFETGVDPRTGTGDSDGDGLTDACDPTPAYDTNPDGDSYPNRQDNCPLVDNEDQLDEDQDGIGDACDQDDWNDDGDTDDPGEPTGFNASVPDGEAAEVWLEVDIDISGPERPEPGQDTDDDGFDDLEEVNLGSDPEDADSTPEDTSVAGTCTDGEDNDLDGYIDDVDGGCGDDTDGDGASDEGEDDLGSDPEDADSTPEDASVAGTCTDGEDNDGDGLTDGDDPGCAVEEETPTPTVVAETPTPTVVAETPTPTVVAEYCWPVFPGTYNGLVRIDGQPADSGYEVTASIGGVQWGSALVSGGRYAMDIPDHMPTELPCFEGGTITFAVDGMTCTASPDADWASGIHTVDLSCAAAPPVTPTPEVTPTLTPTPTITPTTVPPTGAGGLSGSAPGLPVWAMALAGWAGLTIVAGLGTLVAVKRR